jgi:predicted metal-dependent phosphotriesterase family hydrolase
VIVRTILGDIEPSTLGITYCHEHLIIDSPLVADRYPHILLNEVTPAVIEVAECMSAGVGAMVDALPCAAGRDVAKLAEISASTGVHVIAATGLHTARYYPGHRWTRTESADVLAELFRLDIDDGIDAYDYSGPVVRRTSYRAGIIKVATLGEHPDEAERRAFEAAVRAQRASGAPILTHCEDGMGGVAQVELLLKLGAPPERIVLSHTDKRPDLGYHRELLSSGVNLEYDQALRRPPGEPGGTAWLLAQMLAEGFEDRLLLGTDGARRSLWRSLGGSPGLAWLATGFVELLERVGIDSQTRRRLFVDNPARVLAFEPGAPARRDGK